MLASILEDTGIDAALKKQLKRELEDLRKLSEPIRTHRNKYLAHLDRAIAAREGPPPPPVPWVLIECLINSAEHIYHQYRKAVYDSDVDFRLHALGGPTDLIRVLRAGERWRAQHKAKGDE